MPATRLRSTTSTSAMRSAPPASTSSARSKRPDATKHWEAVQIISQALFSTGKNDWATPQALFDELNAEFHFTLDPCATPETAKCTKFYTEEDNGLVQDWTGETVFCNPPYSDQQQTEWVRKCYEHGLRGGGSSHANTGQNRHKTLSRLYLREGGSAVYQRPAQVWRL